MSDDVTLLPCPNPWCDCPNELTVEPIIGTGKYGVECGCGFNGPVVYSEDAARAAWNTRTPSPDSGERMREAGYVAGPVYRSSMEPEGDVWSAEIQVIGGHYVAAEVYGSTEDEARARQSVILAALQESAR